MIKIVLIGIDGATLNIMLPWIKLGKLPFFAKIYNQSVHGNLNSTIPCYSAPAWVSMVTGVHPGKHGIYDFYRTDSFSIKIADSRFRKTPALWNLLTRNDKKSIVVNVPGTFPPEKINGVMITGLLTPSPESNFTYPKQLKEDLKPGKLGIYKLEQIGIDDLSRNLSALYAPEKLINQINLYTVSHAEVTLNLMKKYDWDFTMIVFRGTDPIMHYLWGKEKFLLKCFQKVDEYIGKIVENFPEASYIIVSDHGFGQSKKCVYVNNLLYNHGYIKTFSNPEYNFKAITFDAFEKFSRYLFYLIPFDKIARFSLGRKIIFSTASESNINFSETKALYFSVCSRGIKINLKNGNDQGYVNKEDYGKTRAELIKIFQSLKDPKTGEKVLKNVYNSEELYGKNAENKPLDIILDFKPGYSAQCLLKPIKNNKSIMKKKGHLSVFSKPGFYDWKGDHSQSGILFMYGKNFKKNKIIDASIVDIVPTILASFNLSIPDYIDGQVINAAFIKKPEIKKIHFTEDKNQFLTSSEIQKIQQLREVFLNPKRRHEKQKFKP